MIFELSQEFYFEAAHTLEREIESESSRRIHGHTYHVQITIRGLPDEVTGMVMDLGHFRAAAHACRDMLDHMFLDDIEGLGPPTLENLCRFIAARLTPVLPTLQAVTVFRRVTGDSCTLRTK
jgi:6-pyruvoyltetrahydropterin/6-carboxytetrahydropterin synthase